MKYALIIPDGCADEPQESLGDRTPLQAADIPYMDAIARDGILGRASTVPELMPSGSDVGMMSLFGYDPTKYHTGRAPLEAAAQGIELGPEDWAIRCNFVTVDEGVMKSFTAGQIPDELARELIGMMQQELSQEPNWEFHAGVGYRNLLIYRSQGAPAPFDDDTETFPPHDATDKLTTHFLPRGPGAGELQAIMDRSVEILARSESNRARRNRGELPATEVWLWGQGKRPALEPFTERFRKTGAVITAVDLLRGLGRLLGWKIVEVPGATGYIDTDYAAKGRAAVAALDEVDLVVVHVEATDEASHEGNAEAKVEALQRIDADIVGPVYEALRERGQHRILVCPDHPTFLRTKTHSHGDVPFVMAGTAIFGSGAAEHYDEPTAAQSKLRMKGYELMPMFLG